MQDNNTPWDSLYLAVSSVLEVKDKLDMFCKKHRPGPTSDALTNYLLTHAHWYHLSRLRDCLNLFHIATFEAEGNDASFYDSFSQLSLLLGELDNWRMDFADEAAKDPTFATLSDTAQHAWLQSEKYYKLADDTPFPYAALILNQTMEKQRFADRWASGTVEQSCEDFDGEELVQDSYNTDSRL